MSSSFFYSQDHDCSVCSSSLHPTLLTPSLISYREDVSSIIDLYWDEEPLLQASAATKTHSTRPKMGTRQTSNHSIASSSPSAAGSTVPTLLSSSASTMTSTSNSTFSTSSAATSTSSPPTLFSRRFRLKKAISNLSLRQYKSSSDDLASPRSAKSLDDRTSDADLLLPPPTSHPATPEDSRRYCLNDNEIHPYNFFEASLHMSPDYSILEDGWLRLRTESRFR